jgi:hypothetical protein
MTAVLDGAGDNAFQLKSFEGLEEIVKGAAAEGAGGDVDIMHGREHDHGEAGMIGGDPVEQRKAVGAGHHDIGEGERVCGVLREKLNSFVSSGGRDDGIAAVFEQCGYNAANRRFIVDYEDSFLLHEDVRLPRRAISFSSIYRLGEPEHNEEGPIA